MRIVLAALVAAAASAPAAAQSLTLAGRLESETERAIFHESLLPRPGTAMPEQIERYRRTMSSWRPSASAAVAAAGAGSAPVFFPTSFGADPTGKTDSTAAMQSLMKALLSVDAGKMAQNITNLGGATVDLQGGVYLISSPLVIPANFGNAQFIHGTLRASSSWADASRFLVEVGDSSCKNGQASCNMNIAFTGILFDSSHIAAGSIVVTATMGTVIGPMTYHTGFVQAGVKLDGGHETMVSQSWFCEYYWGDPRKENATLLQESAGVLINGNDHFVFDTIVAGARNGIVLNGAANLVQGVHTWNDATAHGGRGMVSTSGQNRFIGVYLDFNDLTIVDPSSTVVSDAFFLGGGRIEMVPGHGHISGFDVRDCVFRDPYGIPDGHTIIVNTTSPWSSGKPFSDVVDFTVAGTTVQSVPAFRPLAPRVTLTATTDASGNATFDFGPHMPLTGASAPLQSVELSVASASSWVTGAAQFDAGALTVTVKTTPATAGALVSVTADQSKRSVNL